MRISIHQPRHLFTWFYTLLIAMLLLAGVAGMLYPTSIDGLHFSSARTLDDNWSFVQNNKLHPLGTLPETFDAGTTDITLRHPITPDMHGEQEMLAFKTYFAAIRVWADDTLIYASPESQAKIPSACWHFISMANSAGAEVLTIQLQNYEPKTTFFFEKPLLDSPGAIQTTLLQKAAGTMIFAVIGLLLIVVLLFCALMLRKWRSPASQQMLALAVFVFLSCLWALLDGQVFSVYGGNVSIQYYLGCAAFFLLPAPYLLYVRLTTRECQRSTAVLIALTLLNTALALTLRIFDLVSLSSSLYTAHALIIITVIVSSVAFWRTVVVRREKKLLIAFVGMSIVYAIVLVSLILFYNNKFVSFNASSPYTLGLCLLLLFMAADAFAAFGRQLRQREVADRYRRMAMEDSMTGLNNRNAFHLHWNALIENPPDALAVIVFDVDDLKKINDSLGHQAGDRAIVTAAHLIRETFDPVGNCYRTGGDEFDVFVESHNIDAIPPLLTHFAETVAQNWNPALPSDGISYGWASVAFDAKHPLTEVMLVSLRAEADNALYNNKTARKAQDKEAANA